MQRTDEMLIFFRTVSVEPRDTWGRSVRQTVSPIRGCFGIILIFFNTAYRDEGIDQLRTKKTTINQTYPKTNTTTLFLTYRDHFLCQLGSRRMMYWSRFGIVQYAFFSRKNHRFFRDVRSVAKNVRVRVS